MSKKEKAPSLDQIRKQKITEIYNQSGRPLSFLTKVRIHRELRYLAAGESGLELYSPSGQQVSLADKFDWSRFSTATVDHFAIKSKFKLKGDKIVIEFDCLEKGRKLARLISERTQIKVSVVPRTIFNKILGYRSVTTWKMVIATFGYALIFLTILINLAVHGVSSSSYSSPSSSANTTSISAPAAVSTPTQAPSPAPTPAPKAAPTPTQTPAPKAAPTPTQTPTPSPAPEPATKLLKTGGKAIVNKQTMAGVTKDDFNMLLSYANQHNTDGWQQMMEQGQAFILNQGDEVNVLDVSMFTGTKIQVINGDLRGQTGYVPYEMLTGE